METQHNVLQAHLQEWLDAKGDRKKRGELINTLSKATKLHPKSIGRSMRTLQCKSKRKPKKKRGRRRYYDKAVDACIHEVWTCMECPCAEVMHPMISTYMASFERAGAWHHNDEATGKFRAISLGTLKNRVGAFRKKEGTLRGYSATKPSTVALCIPIRKSHTWATLPPGYGQTDTVVHCGDLLTGDVLYSLGIVDFATYWTEYTAQWNKGQEATQKSLVEIRGRFPFAFHELHPDTGNEFINHLVYAWTQKEGIAMTRSEPYKKNDNMCIEERNNSIPRRHLGYVRIDDQSLVSIATDILRVAGCIHNHFRPVRRMLSKVRIGSQWKRTYEKVARTPYERVLVSHGVSKCDKEKLRQTHTTLDPLRLQKELARLKTELRRKLKQITKKRK